MSSPQWEVQEEWKSEYYIAHKVKPEKKEEATRLGNKTQNHVSILMAPPSLSSTLSLLLFTSFLLLLVDISGWRRNRFIV